VQNDFNILVNDSCILFDLFDLDLLNDFFSLGFKFYTTPQVISEITDDGQQVYIQEFIDKGILIIDNYGKFESIQFLYDTFPGLSFTDCSVLELSIRINGILLSSDKGLRNITRSQNIQVRGVLWIIKKMVEDGILTKVLAIEKLQYYPRINVRAPINDIKKLIDNLKIGIK
jgi:hypothetical protein